MMGWLDGFEWQAGRLLARVITPDGRELLDDFGQLTTRGLPEGDYESRAPFTSEFSTWRRESADRYLAGVGLRTTSSTRHTVFTFRHGRTVFVVPALAVFRGLFPLIPDAFGHAFSPRSLEVLCTPVERNGHWSVVMPEQTGVYRARFRTATVESLTWASLYPSARQTWVSVYHGMRRGEMNIDLPKATARILLRGVRAANTVYVTDLRVSAVLAQDPPFEFAAKGPSSFLWTTNASPLGAVPNAYYAQTKQHALASSLALTDAQWAKIEPICFNDCAKTGRPVRLDMRALVDSFVLRAKTGERWANVAIPPLAAAQVEAAWNGWKNDGRLQRVLGAINEMRTGIADCPGMTAA